MVRPNATSATIPTSRWVLNAKSAQPEEAKTFLEWMATAEFAELYANALPGFFPLSNVDEIAVEDPIAAEFLSWRGECNSTIRSAYQILSRGEPKGQPIMRTTCGQPAPPF